MRPLNKKPLVLVVDDDHYYVRMLTILLTDNGYEVAAAFSGKEALNFVVENSPDIILLDIVMADMDGYSVCRKIKENDLTRYLPVIFLTARTDPEDIARGFEVGGVDYVTKPFYSVELLARVKTHIEMKILRGIISICSNCKKIRNDEGGWIQLEKYLRMNSDALFSHSLCKECAEKLYGGESWFQEVESP